MLFWPHSHNDVKVLVRCFQMLLSDDSIFGQISILISGAGVSLTSVSSEFLLPLPSSDSCHMYHDWSG